jgi:hypothetical protein
MPKCDQLLLLCAQRPVFGPHVMAVALPASYRIDMVLATAPEAYLEVQPALLGNLFFSCVRDWHLVIIIGAFFTLMSYNASSPRSGKFAHG